MAQTTYRDRPLAGVPGQLYSVDGDYPNIRSGFNNEDSALIPFGVAVQSVPYTDTNVPVFERNQGVKKVASDTTQIWGIALHSHEYSSNSVGEITAGVYGIKAAAAVNVLRIGRVLVKPEASSGVVPGARLYVRKVVSGSEVYGALRGSADSTDCLDCSNQGEWITAPDADGLAVLEVNFVVEAVNDTDT